MPLNRVIGNQLEQIMETSIANEHFDTQLLKELVWKLDREVWAHVQNPEPSEEWSTSKAREETTRLLKEYLGDVDRLKIEVHGLKSRINELESVIKEGGSQLQIFRVRLLEHDIDPLIENEVNP